MAQFTNWTTIRYEDALIVLGLAPPVPVGGQNIEFTISKNLGSFTPYITKSVASGYNGASGITITNSGIGTMQIRLNAPETSGFAGNYAYQCRRLDSGFVTLISEGFVSFNL